MTKCCVWVRVGEVTLAIPVDGPAPPDVEVGIVDGDTAVTVELGGADVARVQFHEGGPAGWVGLSPTTTERRGEADGPEPSPVALQAPHLRLLRAA